MASPFSRTLRSLRSDRSTSSILAVVALLVVFGLWLLWLVSARLPIYAKSIEARLEVDQAVHQVAATVSGRIVYVHSAVGQTVVADEVLFELDSELEQRRRDEEIARREALLREIESLKAVLATETQGLMDARKAAGAAILEAQARSQAEVAAAELAEEEARRSARLHEQGLTSEMELRRAEATARERRARADALERAVDRGDSERLSERRDRRVRIDQLRRELAELEGNAETSSASILRLEEEIARRLIRSPTDGRLGEVAQALAGSVVRAGDHLATVVPTAELKVVAGFPPSDAIARVRQGQPAQLRLDGFPWTEFGSMPAEVTRVSSQARDGKLWIDSSVNPGADSAIPLQHGMPGTLVVEVERISPVELVLRAAGRAVTARSSAAARGSE